MRFYERQGAESPAAFRAFVTYRDLGPERSLDAAYRLHNGCQESRKRASGRWKEWAKKYDWVARVQAFDDYHAMLKAVAIEEYEREQGGDQAAREAAIQQQLLEAKERLLDRITEMLDFPLERVRVEHKDGKEIHHHYPAKWSYHSLIKAVEVLDTGAQKIDVRRVNFDNLTDEQLERIANGENLLQVLLDSRRDADEEDRR